MKKVKLNLTVSETSDKKWKTLAKATGMKYGALFDVMMEHADKFLVFYADELIERFKKE